MKAVETSLSLRAGRRAADRVRVVAGCSIVGRFFVGLARIIRRACADSAVFGVRRSGSRRLEKSGHPWSVLLISRPYLWLRRAAGGGAAEPEDGRGLSSGTGPGLSRVATARLSHFGGGGWAPVVGAGIFALGCGRLAVLIAWGTGGSSSVGSPAAPSGVRLIVPAILIVVGALVVAGGPTLRAGLRTSRAVRLGRWLGGGAEGGALPARRAAGRVGVGGAAALASAVTRDQTARPAVASVPPFSWHRLAGPLGAAAALAAAAGLLAGLSSGRGSATLVAAVAALCAFVVVFWRPEVMLLAVAAFPWLDWAARRTLGGLGAGWDDAFLLFSVVVLLWCVIVLRRSELWTVPVLLPVLLALTAAIGSVALEHVPGDVALFALRVTFQPLLFYFLGFLFPKSKRWVQGVVGVFLAASVALALHGLYQYVTHAPMPASWVDVREVGIGTRAYSIIGNPNGLGAFLLLGSLLSLNLALTRGLRARYRAIMAVVCAVEVLGVAVTFSRGAWIGLAAGIVALLIMAHRRYIAPLVALGVLGWFAAPQQFVGRLTFAFSSAYLTKSAAAGRLYVWKMALQYIWAHPFFGVGLGTFGGTSAVMFGYGRYWVDNFYLQLAAEGGLILLLFFLWILVRAAKSLVKSHGMASDPFWRGLTAGVFGGFIAVVVANVTASVWETLVVGVGFWFLAGLASSAVLQSSEASAGERVRGGEAGDEPGRPEKGRWLARTGA